MNRSTLAFLTSLTLLCGIGSAEDLNCLKEGERAASSLYAQLQQKAYVALDRRTEACEALKTPADIRGYQQRLRVFCQATGRFPGTNATERKDGGDD